MKIIDILILILSIAGLFYFYIFDRRKYKNRDVFHQKLARLDELDNIIFAIETKNKKRDGIFNVSPNMDTDNSFADERSKFMSYDKNFELLKKERKKILSYIKNARMYHKNI